MLDKHRKVMQKSELMLFWKCHLERKELVLRDNTYLQSILMNISRLNIFQSNYLAANHASKFDFTFLLFIVDVYIIALVCKCACVHDFNH